MSAFLITFFLIYGSVNLYAFLRARSAFGFGISAGAPLGLLFLLMVFAPILIRLLEKGGYEFTARWLAFIGYLWMGLLFLFFTSSLVLDLYRFIISSAAFFLRFNAGPFLPSAKVIFAIPLFYAMCVGLYGYFEARRIRVERVVIRTNKLPLGVERVRIAQLSDVHLGLLVREKRLAPMVAAIALSKPDIVVSTGDFVDGQLNNLSTLVEPLRQLQAPMGKFAITGNHEFYAGLDQALGFTRACGFRVLRGEAVEAGPIVIAGIDDPAGKGFGGKGTVGEAALLGDLPADRFILFLKHRPAIERESLGRFDLQLSGHVHDGQIFPFRYLTRLFFPILSGLSHFGDRSYLYVSRGTGTWGPPIRFLAPPEVTVIDLVRE